MPQASLLPSDTARPAGDSSPFAKSGKLPHCICSCPAVLHLLHPARDEYLTADDRASRQDCICPSAHPAKFLFGNLLSASNRAVIPLRPHQPQFPRQPQSLHRPRFRPHFPVVFYSIASLLTQFLLLSSLTLLLPPYCF